MQVNGALNSIEKSRLMNNDSYINYSIFYVTLTIRLFDDRCPSMLSGHVPLVMSLKVDVNQIYVTPVGISEVTDNEFE